jgi:hypothetical protein
VVGNLEGARSNAVHIMLSGPDAGLFTSTNARFHHSVAWNATGRSFTAEVAAQGVLPNHLLNQSKHRGLMSSPCSRSTSRNSELDTNPNRRDRGLYILLALAQPLQHLHRRGRLPGGVRGIQRLGADPGAGVPLSALLLRRPCAPVRPERDFFFDNLLVNHRDDWSRPALRHGILKPLFQVAFHLPS